MDVFEILNNNIGIFTLFVVVLFTIFPFLLRKKVGGVFSRKVTMVQIQILGAGYLAANTSAANRGFTFYAGLAFIILYAASAFEFKVVNGQNSELKE